MSPTLVLDRHGELLSRCEDARFVSVLDSWFSLDLGAHAVPDRRERERVEHNGRVLRTTFIQQVRTAYAYRVTEEMSLVVQQAAAALDATDTVQRDLAPTGAGIVRFDSPLPIQDVRGNTMKVHWLVWGPTQTEDGPVLQVTMFNDGDEPEDFDWLEDEANAEAYRQVVGRWNWVGATYHSNGSPLGDEVQQPSEELVKYGQWQGFEAMPTTNGIRYLHALWLLMNQTIVAVDDQAPDRAGRKRAERRKIPARVSVIQLRRTESRGEGESTVEWQHRWLVRGHWAWRNCGPDLDGAQPYDKGYRRRLFIPGYVKGPESKPLVVTDKVYDLSR